MTLLSGRFRDALRILGAARSLRDAAALGGYLTSNAVRCWAGIEPRSPEEMLIRFREVSLWVRKFSSELTPYQEIFLDRIYEKAPRTIAQPGAVVLDVGANIGTYSLRQAVLAGPRGRIFAFEPNPDAFSRLVKNLALNEASNVEPIHSAVSDRTGEIRFLSNPRSTLAGRILSAPGRASDSPLSLPSVCLDDFISQRGLRHVDILKIDVEGAELEVLAGAPRTLGITDVIVLEYHSEHLRDQVLERMTHDGRFHKVHDEAAVLYFQTADPKE